MILSFASHAFAEGFVALAPIPDLTDTSALSVANSTNLASFFNNLYKYLIGLAAVLAVIEIIWGGLEISTKDSVSKQSDGKERITQAIFGLVLVLSPVIVFSIINPSILNLSLNLEPLDTKSAPVNTSSSSAQPAQLSNADAQLRQGVQVLDTFTIPSADQMSLAAKKKFLDDQQVACSAKSGNLGIIMPVVGDAGKYVCQTCPPNTSPTLYAPGRSIDSPRGACNAN
ncbi:MAG: pilin [Candidatus Pacebacteria bacterium]|nr:pilin [Candidatus Paceibacterota bacterium]